MRPIHQRINIFMNTGIADRSTIFKPTLAVLLIAIIFVAFAVSGCKKSSSNIKPPDVDYYTCTMHPSVKKQHPKDKCPICGMDLVPVKKKGAAAGHDHGQKNDDAQSMGMSAEEHAKMGGGKDQKEMKGMKGTPGM